jgi:hypothetical protein
MIEFHGVDLTWYHSCFLSELVLTEEMSNVSLAMIVEVLMAKETLEKDEESLMTRRTTRWRSWWQTSHGRFGDAHHEN